MKFHKQEILSTDFGGGKGSCYPTAMACILDLELKEVPYFNLFYWRTEEEQNFKNVLKNIYDETFVHNKISIGYSLWDIVREIWLASKGYKQTYIEKNEIENWIKENKNIPYLVVGLSKRNIDHVVIYQNGKMIHDPHPDNSGVILTEDREYPYSFLEKIC